MNEHKEEYKKYNREYVKKYNEYNKELIKEKRKEKYTCDCGSIFLKCCKKKHEKSKKHIKFITDNT